MSPVSHANLGSKMLCNNYLAWLSCTAALEREDSRYRCGLDPKAIHGTCWADKATGTCTYQDHGAVQHRQAGLIPIKPVAPGTPLSKRLA